MALSQHLPVLDLYPCSSAPCTMSRARGEAGLRLTHEIANPVTEGLNSTIQTINQMACGSQNREDYRNGILFIAAGSICMTVVSQKLAYLWITLYSGALAKVWPIIFFYPRNLI
jgi:hypothetical protein